MAGAPILNQVVLIVAKVTTHLGSATQVSSCPFILYDELDFLLEIPILTLLAFNFLFLLWVIIVSQRFVVRDIYCNLTFIPFSPFQIVVSKLNQQTVRLDHERRHFKAAKVCSIFIRIYVNG